MLAADVTAANRPWRGCVRWPGLAAVRAVARTERRLCEPWRLTWHRWLPHAVLEMPGWHVVCPGPLPGAPPAWVLRVPSHHTRPATMRAQPSCARAQPSCAQPPHAPPLAPPHAPPHAPPRAQPSCTPTTRAQPSCVHGQPPRLQGLSNCAAPTRAAPMPAQPTCAWGTATHSAGARASSSRAAPRTPHSPPPLPGACFKTT